MTFGTLIVALIWGMICGYAFLRIFDSVVALGVCLHGLSLSPRRKKKSAAKPEPDSKSKTKKKPSWVNPRTIRKLMWQIGLYLFFFALVVYLGDSVVKRQLFFSYQGSSVVVWGVAAAAIFLLRLRTSFRRIALIHRLSHERDYAEKRDRTYLLK
ncbi:hypothetical protein [Geoalkalibacter subterraneus]|uniref:Uncharacterized protein n=1 Tax=Geoalkalibacter subterraneus TaxID=483547 RepID=A0A0B5FFY4_9BACT|nr:hypothetical protein [Geoalkalibacter subterraneus]AJF06243.1 hypothetical protein GSUB_06300 [Geoalkalibacter subterraneus]